MLTFKTMTWSILLKPVFLLLLRNKCPGQHSAYFLSLSHINDFEICSLYFL